ncbi:hypothetical protein BSL78_21951 [Apostichopus japonicus]|uniref:Uncharacterized protein n=1 Tax=Stichopus japonicus TaxID=307972 RepID=A0A2G8JZQ9_STIJA|nr:hypothetical protein BSL78_21951 [Apostichopus japonicus]
MTAQIFAPTGFPSSEIRGYLDLVKYGQDKNAPYSKRNWKDWIFTFPESNACGCTSISRTSFRTARRKTSICFIICFDECYFGWEANWYPSSKHRDNGNRSKPLPPYNAGPPDKSRENSMGRTSMYDYGDSEESEGEESEVEEIHEEPRYASVPFRGRDQPNRGTISSRPRMESPRGSDDDSLDDSDLEEEPVQDISPGRMPSRGKPRDNSPSPGPQTSRTTPRTSATGYEVPSMPNLGQFISFNFLFVLLLQTQELQGQGNSQASTDSDLTEVTNPADDFSDLIISSTLEEETCWNRFLQSYRQIGLGQITSRTRVPTNDQRSSGEELDVVQREREQLLETLKYRDNRSRG